MISGHAQNYTTLTDSTPEIISMGSRASGARGKFICRASLAGRWQGSITSFLRRENSKKPYRSRLLFAHFHVILAEIEYKIFINKWAAYRVSENPFDKVWLIKVVSRCSVLIVLNEA